MSGEALRAALRRRERSAVARFFPTAVVLAYHRVASPSLDPQLMCVSPERLAEHLQVIRRVGECVSLRDLVRLNAIGRMPRRAIAVTFDDGYADNLIVAEPLLRAAAVPATVFVSTGGLEEGRRFWWDRLETLLLGTTRPPRKVVVTAHGRQYEWALSAPDAVRESSVGSDAAKWDITQKATPGLNQVAYREISSLCRGLPPEEREIVLDDLMAQLGESQNGVEHRRLTSGEVVELAASTVVEVGAHGVSHTPLSVLAAERRAEELWLNKRQLEEMTGRPVDLLSYPFGASGDLTDDCGRKARDCGYMAACANRAKLMWRHSDPYRLPRFLVRDWDGEDFASRLKAWFEGLD